MASTQAEILVHSRANGWRAIRVHGLGVYFREHSSTLKSCAVRDFITGNGETDICAYPQNNR